jgi:hypothetical protein
MTYDELLMLAKNMEGKVLTTKTGRQFEVGVFMD